MAITKEDLIIKHLDNMVIDIKELRTESKEQTASLLRLESEFDGFKTVCKNTHCTVDSKIEALNSFKKEHELIKITELNQQVNRKIQWKDWRTKIIVGIPLTMLVTFALAILKGCILL